MNDILTLKTLEQMLNQLDIDLFNFMESLTINFHIITIEQINKLYPSIKAFMYNWFREYFSANQSDKIEQLKYLPKEELSELEDLLNTMDTYTYNFLKIVRAVFYF